jgi:hypothetical protein
VYDISGLMHYGNLALSYLNYDRPKLLVLCKTQTKDWAEQAACMDKVYRGGICNLAACDISDSRDSIFSPRQPQAGVAIVHRQTYTDSSAVFTAVPNWPRLTWDVSNLYRRAWVVQEGCLSPRIIHFSQFPIWECKSTLVTEGFPPNNSIRSSDNFPSFPEWQRGWLFASGEQDGYHGAVVEVG